MPRFRVPYGVREGRLIRDQRDRNPLTGAAFVVPALANPRFAPFTLPALSRAEATDAHRDLVRRLGAARDALWIPETADKRAESMRPAEAAVAEQQQPMGLGSVYCRVEAELLLH